MRGTFSCLLLAIVGVAALVSACGGGGGTAAATPPVSTSTPAASTPAPAVASGPAAPQATPAPATPSSVSPSMPRVGLPVPAETFSPTAPTAAAGGPNLRNAAPSTVLPLTIVAVTGDFEGDPATTAQGATLSLGGTSGRIGLTLNNERLDVIDATATVAGRMLNGFHVFGAPLTGSRNLQTDVASLEHAAFGYWIVMNEPGSNAIPSLVQALHGGAWSGGYVTVPGHVPTSGRSNFAGTIDGLYDEGRTSVALVRGAVRVSVDFSTRTVSGVIDGVSLGSDNFRHGPVSDLTFSASLDGSGTRFVGNVYPQNDVPGSSGFDRSAAGTIRGRLMGPGATELAATWTIEDSVHRIVGSFGAARAAVLP